MDTFNIYQFFLAVLFCIPSLASFIKKRKDKFKILFLNVMQETLFCLHLILLYYSYNIVIISIFAFWLFLLIWSLSKNNKLSIKKIGWFVFGMSLCFAFAFLEDVIIDPTYHPRRMIFYLVLSVVAALAGVAMAAIPQKNTALPPSALLPLSITDELDKLFALKQKGAITEAEYETRKQQLLKS